MENQYEIAELIQRYLSGNATEKEMREVEEWLQEDVRHREMMAKFKECDWEKVQVSEYDVFDIQEEYVRFLRSKRMWDRRIFIQRCSSVAAVVMLIIGVVIYSQRKEKITGNNVNIAFVRNMPAGGNRAMLILGDGKKVILNDSVKMELTENTARIKVEGELLSYRVDSASDRSVVKQSPLNAIITPRGGEYRLALSDGTKVWLNADSELVFPSEFVGRERVVRIRGEAYFEVAKDKYRPFLIHTDRAVVRVVGTSFNIRSYPNETEKTTLVEGRVDVFCHGKIMSMQPNEEWVYGMNGGEIKKINTRYALSWKNGDFAFEEQKLSMVFKELERWYNVSFKIEDRDFNDIHFTGVFPRYGDLNRVLEIIKMATCVHCQLDNQNVVVVNEQK